LTATMPTKRHDRASWRVNCRRDSRVRVYNRRRESRFASKRTCFLVHTTSAAGVASLFSRHRYERLADERDSHSKLFRQLVSSLYYVTRETRRWTNWPIANGNNYPSVRPRRYRYKKICYLLRNALCHLQS